MRRRLSFLCIFCFILFLTYAPLAVLSQQDEKTVEIEAEGIGIDKDKALLSAFKAAVRQVIGALVESDTEIKNRELIKDQVIAYSNGYIKSYQEISSEQEEGAWRVRIKAVVVNSKLIGKLREMKISTKLDSAGLFAEAVTRLDEKQTSLQLIKGIMDGYPQNAYNVLIGKPEILETKMNGNVLVRIPACIYFKEIFLNKLEKSLEEISKNLPSPSTNKITFVRINIESQLFNYNDFKDALNGIGLWNSEVDKLIPFSSSLFFLPANAVENIDTARLNQCRKCPSSLKSYAMDAEIYQYIEDKFHLKYDSSPIQGKFEILDSNDNIISSIIVGLTSRHVFFNTTLYVEGTRWDEVHLDINPLGISENRFGYIPICRNYKYIFYIEFLFKDPDAFKNAHKIDFKILDNDDK